MTAKGPRGVGLCAALAALACAVAARAQPPTPAPAGAAGAIAVMTRFATKGEAVEVAPGRHINLVCAGQGAPTVILTTGAGGWSINWVKVAPALAQANRVCSWDRPGNGFSDASPHPLDVADDEADLDTVLKVAGIDGPLVLVGASIGGLESLLFADRHRDRVAGMVLVDPSSPGALDADRRVAPKLAAWSREGDRKVYIPYDACIAALEAGPKDPTPQACAALRAGLPPGIQAALKPWTEDPAYWRTFRSELDQRERNFRQAINPKRAYGDMPLVVLSAGRFALPGAPPEVAAEIPALMAQKVQAHRALARLSSRGAYVFVADSGHVMMQDKPQAIVDAIKQVVDEAKVAGN
ncbi:alpha/beta hydrolase [Phenylobacterium sp.]|uniref:alpha/beta fold hydrolase n=1 Tax=Phenylobacterium sp. TaxID=1871053 RepID=UPI001217DF34|nr:alpha/beta hydrolase [Phenylobacterium sp.]THD58615.1 MAG: alpha/beta hydrolase [Phenylobacterium sp.]